MATTVGSGDAVTVTYTAHASLQSSPLYPHICNLLSAQFPLRNLHWRPGPEVASLRPKNTQQGSPPAQSPLRTILELPVRLVPFAEHAPADLRVPLIQRTPMVHLFFVACDDNDIYKAQILSEIRNWIASLPAHLPPDAEAPLGEGGRPDHLIVMVPPLQTPTAASSTHAKGAMGRLYNMNKGTVLEKVRSDFNTATHERVVHMSRIPAINSTPAPADSALWVELIARIKESATATFGAIVGMQDAAITAYDGDKDNWSFAGYLYKTEQLIDTLQHVDLLEDCYALYEALEGRLHAGRADGSVTFPSVGGTDGDDSLLLLGPLRKQYRSMIAKGSISLFDTLCYLYARKAMLLGALGHVVNVMAATRPFVTSVARMLRNADVPPFFVESWSFSVALDAVEQCQAWMVEQSDDSGAQSFAFHASKTDLLELAIEQLLCVGVRVGHLPKEEPFTNCYTAVPSASVSGSSVSRKELKEALEDRSVFDSQVRNLVQRSLVSSSLSKRARHIWQLRYILACLDMERGADAEAHASFDALCKNASRGWGVLLGPVVARKLALLARDKHEPSADTLALALQAISSARPFAGPLDEQDLLERLRRTAAEEVSLTAYNGIYVTIKSQRARAHGDGLAFSVDIHSRLDRAVHIDKVRVCLADYQHNQLWCECECEGVDLESSQTVEVACATPATGFFQVQTTQVVLGNVLIEDNAPGAAGLATLSDVQHHEYARTRIYRAPDGDALKLHIEASKYVRVGVPRIVELVVSTGQNNTDEIDITLEPAEAAFAAPPFKLDAPESVRLESIAGSPLQLKIIGAHAYTECRVHIPLVQEPQHGRLRVSASLRYSVEGSVCERSCMLETILALPLGIQIQDSFRTSSVLSRLVLASAGEQSIRAHAPKLEAIGDCAMSVLAPPPSVVFGPEQASFVLEFAHAKDAKFKLGIVYRPLVLEAVGIVLAHVAETVAKLEWERGHQVLLNDALANHVAGTMDGRAYNISGRIKVDIGRAYWAQLCHWWGWAQSTARAKTLWTILESLASHLAEPVAYIDEPTEHKQATPAATCAFNAAKHNLAWWTLDLVADVPSIGVASAVDLAPQSAGPYVVGQPIDVDVTIKSRINTATNPLKYDILCDYEHWLVWGAKKGTLQVEQPLSTNTVRIVLVPLREGSILFPRVAIAPVDNVVSCEVYSVSAAERVDVLAPSSARTYWAELRGG
ncbi:hypothetical protein MCUN1_002539 [Malassezia cuniculi]|uniref:Uncharacterized protein n=1 Tax=Malassezia cuniculi TaxID=948313 RepID=A0AAF0EZX0_9BASI|nr:hypothetical protein MCUN1_002539 [Malassezia cuniculi]